MIIEKSRYKVIVTNLKKNWFEIKRVSKNHTITTYSNRKEINKKVNLFSLPLSILKKELHYSI